MSRRPLKFWGGIEANGRFDASRRAPCGISILDSPKIEDLKLLRLPRRCFQRIQDHDGLRGSRGLEPLRRLWRHRPLDRFREAVKHLARRALHGHALDSEAVQENSAFGTIKRK